MSAGDAFGFSSYTFPGVRSASFSLWATPSLKPCLTVSVTGVSKGVTTATRLAFTQGGASSQLDVALFEARSTKGRKSVYAVNGASASAAQYNRTSAAWTAAYKKKRREPPRLTFSASYKKSQISAASPGSPPATKPTPP